MTWRPRFSLRTLAVFLLLVTSGMGLWWHWEPWYCERVLRHKGRVNAASFSEDGERVLVLGGSVVEGEPSGGRLWQISNGKHLGPVKLNDEAVGILLGIFSPDGRNVLKPELNKTSPLKSRYAVHDRQSGEKKVELEGSAMLIGHAFSADSRMIVGTSIVTKATSVWDARTGKMLATFQSLKMLSAHSRFSHDGTRIVSVFGDNRAVIWDASSGQQVLVLHGHRDRVLCGVFSPDDARIATGSRDAELRLWQADTGGLLCIVGGHSEAIMGIAFSPDGRRLVSSSWDGSARIWKRRRPEWWWGVFWLWEFWLTVAFAGAFVWSVVRDRRRLANA